MPPAHRTDDVSCPRPTGRPGADTKRRDDRAPVPSRLLDLQARAGNRAVGALVGQLQRAPGPTLGYGANGPAVSDLQQKLNALGARPRLAVDGKFGATTRHAVKTFQRAHDADGLAPSGEVDDATRRVLGSVREIDANEEELGTRIAQDMTLANKKGTETSGLYYARNYREQHGKTATGRALTPKDYEQGYANPDYFVRRGYWDWVLKPGKSAAEGVRAFLRGLTIAECNSVLVAIEMNAIRASVGDTRFDEIYGSADVAVPAHQLLRISPYTTRQRPSIEKLLVTTDAAKGTAGSGTLGKRPVKVGEWYYFQNHPKYPEKHPGADWQGENAVYLGLIDGQQKWSGFGVERVSERYMLNKLISYYNKPRPGWTGSPQTITLATLLDAGGGLKLAGGLRLDADKVRGMR